MKFISKKIRECSGPCGRTLSKSLLNKYGECFQCSSLKGDYLTRKRSHKEIYFDFFKYGIDDIIMSELTDEVAVDIHAIEPDGCGGRKDEAPIEELIALTRLQHLVYGGKKEFKEWLYFIHLRHILKVYPDYEIHPDYIHYLEFDIKAWAQS